MASGSSIPQSFEQVIDDELRALRGPSGTRDPAAPPLSALCISGGGIRSATFGLGALQGLAEQGVLGEFDYLSTVSGGGYIGSWLTCWKHRAGGIDKLREQLCSTTPVPPGRIDPIGHLRDYNNYLSPRTGAFSADTWTLAATYVRNMALNWLVIVPLLIVLLLAPRLILAFGLLGDKSGLDVTSQFGIRVKYSIIMLSGLFLAMAIINTMRYLPGVGRKDHSEGDFLKYCLAPMVFAALGFMTFDAWFDPSGGDGASQLSYLWTTFWITGSCAAAWIAYLLFFVRGVKARLKLLAGPLSLAIALLGIGTSTGAWLLVTQVYILPSWPVYITVGPPLMLVAFMSAAGIFIGLTSRYLGDEDREWLARAAAWMSLGVTAWLLLCGLVLLIPAWLFHVAGPWLQSSIAAAGGFAGWLCSAAGYASRSLPSGDGTGGKPAKKSPLQELVAKAAAPVFVIVFFVALAVLTNWLLSVKGLTPGDWRMLTDDCFHDSTHACFVDNARASTIVGMCAVFMLIGWLSARFININKFSLHAMYRARLIRAYLGASNDRKKANRFIGFDNSDNVTMSSLDPTLKPFHVVNITLNLVGGKKLAWQERKAESFTVSGLHAGSARLGYRSAVGYGGRGGISMGTAVTISGAAASPSMGYHSSGVIGFIMTLFNARLGAWLGNPGEAGEKTWHDDGPKSAIRSLVKEAFGKTDDQSSYVYLSDGGHFENLGLYEMVARRCRRIVVLDSGCDPDFAYEDLGNALRKIRIDLGVQIDFDPAYSQQMRGETKTRRCALAKIRYSGLEEGGADGDLIYIKPVMLGNESPDLATYKASHPDFPHQSTSDQWYDESQTESYRMLGLSTVREICTGWDRANGLRGMIDHVRDVYLPGRALRASA
ncbi:MAG TPA: patatin-like phospholipase family protein [Bryobacteraceae bacterium]|nr:patatin-like phospholipase family protein [Bryobacteraceae bacterium]